ncbi:MAG: hypothetical protein LBU51_03740 [Bacteroidales bacterium]|jgi:hypothetical protein|nr:hypothetical protein [Bacteroidales bacterium]
MSKYFRKEIETNLHTICMQFGFKKKEYVFCKPINENAIARLGFGFATHQYKGHIFVNIFVSVFYKNVEELHSKLMEYSTNGTIGMQIGYLMPEKTYKEWDFVENSDNMSAYADIKYAIETYAFAYFEKMKDIDFFFKLMKERNREVLCGIDKYLPILYYIKGEKEKGIIAIEEAIERISKRPTEEAIRAKVGNPQNMTIIRYDDKRTSEEIKEIEKNLPPGGSIMFVGAGYDGVVDPMYLKFVENYKKLE